MRINKGKITILIGILIWIVILWFDVIACYQPQSETKLTDDTGRTCYIIVEETKTLENNTIIINGTLKPATRYILNDFQLKTFLATTAYLFIFILMFAFSFGHWDEYWEYKTKKQVQREKEQEEEDFFRNFKEYVSSVFEITLEPYKEETKNELVSNIKKLNCPFQFEIESTMRWIPINIRHGESEYYHKNKLIKSFREKLINIVEETWREKKWPK